MVKTTMTTAEDRPTRRLGAALAAAVVAGSALAATPAATATEVPAPAEKAPILATPVADLAARGMEVPDPNADGYDKFIVTYKETASAAATAQGRAHAWGKAAKQAGVSVKELRATAVGSRVIKADKKLSQAESAEFMETLKADPAVESVEPDVIFTAALDPKDALYNQQWGFHGANGMRVPGAWDHSTGSGVTVGIIDTGQTSHPDLDANTVPGYDFISDPGNARDGDGRDADPTDEGDWSVAGECNSPYASDSSWHGSHVAGTVGAVANTEGVVGVAPDVKLQHARVLGKCGGSLSDIADAIVWASGGSVPGVPDNQTPVDVINMSLGGSGACSATYQNAIDSAVSRGVPVVVAAGNDNRDASGATPANCDNVITVAASDSSGNRSSFSNYGSPVDVTAPGTDIISTVNAGKTTPSSSTYAAYNGTSMATPHVAGAVALMLAKDGSLTPAAVESALKDNARSMPGSCSGGCGAGLVDAATTLASLGGGSDPAPEPEPEPEPEPDPDPIGGELLTNGGFEQGATGWLGTGNSTPVYSAAGSHSGNYHAAMNGLGYRNTATIEQRVSLPAGTTSTLSYALRVDSNEGTSAAYDRMSVMVNDGIASYTLKTHSNMEQGRGYATHTADLSRFAGKDVTVFFRGEEDAYSATVFRLDDVSLTAR
ncbi:S8 family serine peptidase [Micrococcus sp. HMSC067E09]|uniref:S8 family serine peptidase n=1 Tax=Micrococcus sp. HMSC067E09 TaxID=1739367 RepID=UPI000AF600DB|nr:S8 family serine peptidase [Micrococcus sp. HMSC067E09]